MDFSLSEEQQLIVDTVRALARDELLPKYTHWDRNDLFPREQWLKMGALGLLGLRVPEACGGQDAGSVTATTAIQRTIPPNSACGT